MWIKYVNILTNNQKWIVWITSPLINSISTGLSTGRIPQPLGKFEFSTQSTGPITTTALHVLYLYARGATKKIHASPNPLRRFENTEQNRIAESDYEIQFSKMQTKTPRLNVSG
jgi:hypothetical protein